MSGVHALALGLVQGLTEFLPVSSSGHLVLASRLLNLSFEGVAFEIWLHLATLVAVLIALRSEVAMLIRALAPGGKADSRGRSWLLGLVIGTLPAVAVGLLAGDIVSSAFSSVRLVGVDLLLTAGVLLLSRRFPGASAPLTPMRAFWIGVAQALAILPGISRSGTTLTAGLMLGLSGADAARFSFLLAIPAILGAVVLNASSLAALGESAPAELFFGFITAAGSGYLAIRLVWRVMERGRLSHFAPYCALVGIVALLMGGAVPR